MAVRIAVPARAVELAGLDELDYADAFAAPVSNDRTPREWVDLILDGVSPAVLKLVRHVHRVIGRMPLAAPGPDHPLGWSVLSATSESVVLGVDGGIVTPRVVVLPEERRLVVTTVLRYEHAGARTLWLIMGAVHRVVARYLVANAVRNATASRSSSLTPGTGGLLLPHRVSVRRRGAT
jgi:hypothetical protein